jgi:hypothetical protein
MASVTPGLRIDNNLMIGAHNDTNNLQVNGLMSPMNYGAAAKTPGTTKGA